ncbi:uncharacterized protein [Littorina saxatilis]|uniref:Uncharacterized protein n=1 Tax=Littorina saxatilis TaxID=31220 RepID=A0AAN9GBL0_9CAEN
MITTRRAEPLLASLLVYGCVLLHLCGGQCPDEGTPSPVLGDKVKRSEVVVQGKVLRQFDVKDRSYSVELRVYCVYKGGPLPAVITITGAGQAAGSCVKTDLPRDSIKLVYLRRSGEQFTPTYTEDPADGKYLDELQFVCGLNVELPTGSGGPNKFCNPDSFENYYDDCQESTPPGTAATTRLSWTLMLCGAVMCVLINGSRLRFL